MKARRILIVDDNEDAASMLEAAFEMMGHEARCAATGASALAMAEAFAPDVVFLDLSLPDMDGFEVARRLRASPGLDRAMLVALTGWSDPAIAARARAEGFAHFFVKPFDPFGAEAILAAAG